MKPQRIEHVIQAIKNKRKVDHISYQDMYLFRHAMSTVSRYEPDNKYSGIMVKDKSGKSMVMIHSVERMGDTERGRLYEFIIMPTAEYDTFDNKDDDKCERIMQNFDNFKPRYVESVGEQTIVPAGILIYDIYDADRVERSGVPANAKLEILYTNRSLRGQGVATRLKGHFNEVLKNRDIGSYFGYSNALDLIDGKDKKNSNEVLKRIYGRMGIHIVPDDPHGLFFGYPKEFDSILLPTKYLNPLHTITKQPDLANARPMALVEELSK